MSVSPKERRPFIGFSVDSALYDELSRRAAATGFKSANLFARALVETSIGRTDKDLLDSRLMAISNHAKAAVVTVIGDAIKQIDVDDLVKGL